MTIYRLIYSPERINIHIGACSLVNLYGKCVTPESVSFHKTRCFIKPFKINNLPIKQLLRKAIIIASGSLKVNTIYPWLCPSLFQLRDNTGFATNSLQIQEPPQSPRTSASTTISAHMHLWPGINFMGATPQNFGFMTTYMWGWKMSDIESNIPLRRASTSKSLLSVAPDIWNILPGHRLSQLSRILENITFSSEFMTDFYHKNT